MMTHDPSDTGDRNENSARFETRPELERALRQTLGLPKAAARKLVAGGWPALSRQQPADDYRPMEKEISEMSIQDLREKRHAKADEVSAFAGKKNWNEAVDKPIYDAMLTDVRDIDRQIDRLNDGLMQSAEKIFGVVAGNTNLGGEYWATDAGKVPVMRKGSDFKSFYRAESGPASGGNEPITMSDFFRGIAGGRTTPGVRNALSEGTNSAGGYAVPTLLMPNILEALVPVSSLLQAGAGIHAFRDHPVPRIQ